MDTMLPWRRIGAGIGTDREVDQATEQVSGEQPLVLQGGLALAGDWHGEWYWVRNVLEKAAEAGVRTVVQLGDFGIWPGGEKYLESISRLCTQLDMTVLWVDGNHEDFEQLGRYPLVNGLRPVRPRLWNLPRGLRWSWEGHRWLALGGATSLDRALRTSGKDWWPQEAITSEEEESVKAAGRADVMVTHDCPMMVEHNFGVPPSFWDMSDLALADAHRERLQRIVEEVQPRQLYHGHLHRYYQRHLEAGWGEVTVTGLDCNGSDRGHALVLDPRTLEITAAL